MAKLPTPEESGRRILAIFADDNLRPGEMMLFACLYPRFLEKDARADDFEPGWQWLVDRGYLEVRTKKRPPERFFLTDAGFREMQAALKRQCT